MSGFFEKLGAALGTVVGGIVGVVAAPFTGGASLLIPVAASAGLAALGGAADHAVDSSGHAAPKNAPIRTVRKVYMGVNGATSTHVLPAVMKSALVAPPLIMTAAVPKLSCACNSAGAVLAPGAAPCAPCSRK